MTQSSGGARLDIPKSLKIAGLFAGVAAAVSIAAVPALFVVNGVQSNAEFKTMQNQIMLLTEQGKLTAKDGTPIPYTIKHKGQEFAVNVQSALITQNNISRDAGGQVVQGSQTVTGNGAISSQSYVSSYEIRGLISRTKGSDNILRPFFDDGGGQGFAASWVGAKPVHAPLSAQPTMGMIVHALPQANPGAAPIPAPAPAS